MKLPIDFEKRMKNMLGTEYEDYLDSFNAPAQKALQLNTARMSNEDFAKTVNFSIEPMAHLPNAYYFSGERLGANPLHHAGVIYSQDPSAMLPVGAFDISPDWKVLDVCAAPGGKSFQIAARLQQGNGFLVSNELHETKYLCQTQKEWASTIWSLLIWTVKNWPCLFRVLLIWLLWMLLVPEKECSVNIRKA